MVTPNLLIRRSMESVRSVRLNPYPQVSVLPGVQQRRHGPAPSGQFREKAVRDRHPLSRPQRDWREPRPSAFQAGHIPSCGESCESYALSPVADDSGWLLLLLSSLLSAVGPVPPCRGLPADDSVTPWSSLPSPGLFPATRPRPVLSQAPPPNPIAAELDGRRVLSRGGAADHAVTP